MLLIGLLAVSFVMMVNLKEKQDTGQISSPKQMSAAILTSIQR